MKFSTIITVQVSLILVAAALIVRRDYNGKQGRWCAPETYVIAENCSGAFEAEFMSPYRSPLLVFIIPAETGSPVDVQLKETKGHLIITKAQNPKAQFSFRFDSSDLVPLRVSDGGVRMLALSQKLPLAVSNRYSIAIMDAPLPECSVALKPY